MIRMIIYFRTDTLTYVSHFLELSKRFAVICVYFGFASI